MSVVLPRRDTVEKTGQTDPVLFHYRPVMGAFLVKRLAMVLQLMGPRRYDRLLDGGCGGGIFLPELARRTNELHAIDVHDRLDSVSRMAAENGVSAAFRRASLATTGFPDRFFDAVVVVSVLEFLPDPGAALDEIRRITKEGGDIFLGFPAANPLVDLGYAWLRVTSSAHRSTHADIRREAGRRFTLERQLRFPKFPGASLYFAAHYVNRQ